jgi:pimeloyl-ACP methyl ester carboxylesterase
MSRGPLIGLTRRGNAPSAVPARGYALADLTAHITALMDHNSMPKTHLVAHSIAGAEATQLAIEHPERVMSVVYLDAALDAAKGEAVLAEMPVPYPTPAPGTPYAQVREWWTRFTPNFSRVKTATLALYPMPASPPLPPNTPADKREQVQAFWRDRWLPVTREMIERYQRTAPNGLARDHAAAERHGGWRTLAEQYNFDGHLPETRFHFRSAKFGSTDGADRRLEKASAFGEVALAPLSGRVWRRGWRGTAVHLGRSAFARIAAVRNAVSPFA